VDGYVKRRNWPEPGSIPDVLDMFRCELRFYREIAPVVGVRVPACYQAEETDQGTFLVLEDLSGWQPGADPAAAARLLSGMHQRWQGLARRRWPWIRADGAAIDLVAKLFDQTWPQLADRGDLTPSVRAIGSRFVGHVADAEDLAALLSKRLREVTDEFLTHENRNRPDVIELIVGPSIGSDAIG